MGSSHDTSRLVVSRTPVTDCTAIVLGEGTRTSKASDDGPFPRMFTAATETLYDALLTRPTRVQRRVEASQFDWVTVGAVFDVAVSA